MFSDLKDLFLIPAAVLVLALGALQFWNAHRIKGLEAQAATLQADKDRATREAAGLRANLDEQDRLIESWRETADRVVAAQHEAMGKAQTAREAYQGILAGIAVAAPPREAEQALAWATTEAARIQEAAGKRP